jgi:hypothetical protein
MTSETKPTTSQATEAVAKETQKATAKASPDPWAKADVIMKPLGGIITAMAVAWFGFHASETLDRRQALDTNARVYAQLMSQREDAETSLRKDMFNSIIGSFLTPRANGYEQQVLNLELLAYNFHEALDLGPLFKHVYDKISDSQKPDAARFLTRLERAANEVKGKQIAALEDAGAKFDATIDLDELDSNPAGLTVIEGPLPLRNIGEKMDAAPRNTNFKVEALFADRKRKEIRVKLEVRTPNQKQNGGTEDEANFLYSIFSISPFDFPMIDNTRLPHGQRCAIVVRRFGGSDAEITLVYFPGSRASLKEKPFYDEVMNDLLYTKNALDERMVP